MLFLLVAFVFIFTENIHPVQLRAAMFSNIKWENIQSRDDRDIGLFQEVDGDFIWKTSTYKGRKELLNNRRADTQITKH